ncbi:acetyl-CoA hydrolase/transferase C-terminal domain-containing protein [Lysobacter sp. CFH 32150]|uniref:acetyl-CoA hydrolase/transferase C-terminal domain-containing protein n=1 Tax=Lysobacter sp. CFH 32150 TaxID=2927128 RepID=UPI001FA71322|nr:acetyl-CoA hydrolase/transferase C-terminal domain-containing protein [Lysobacter sp. CFH 32150]MCI4568605.1 acetyl-CoA hydrolase [Lysobacter sp. CFH 32150]
MQVRPPPALFDTLDAAVDFVLLRTDGPLHVGAQLGLGKPHRLLNALYERIEHEPARRLHLYTALSLDPPQASGHGLEARFLGPFVEHHFGADFPRLAYVQAMKRDALPKHVEIEEFYFQSGALLDSAQAQRRYASLNYTQVAKALVDRGMNVLLQKVAREPGGARLSLSCNTDLTFDAIDAIVARGLPRPLLIAEVDPELPWLGGTAAVDADFFDAVVTPPGPYPKLFGLPRQPVADAEYAIGFYASTLVRDGGTLQIGIGALADALCHALALRHIDNKAYRRVLASLDPALVDPLHTDPRDLAPFSIGLYGCSEMLNEGFKRLVECGVIRRKVVDDAALMRRINDGSASEADHATLERDGEFLHGAFYLGSPAFYDWLRNLSDDERRGIGMKRVSEVNELYGGNETLERLQRRDSRFFNTCMMATALGAAVSDALDDGRVVSGVGGQYNFVAMAHALPEARSVLMLRAARDAGGRTGSNIVWNYGHTTIPRHLRDVYVSEYGIADVRGKTDEDCVLAMTRIADARFQNDLLDTAKRNRKLRMDFAAPAAWASNQPARLRTVLAPLRRDGTLPDYPLGSDFTVVEQRLVKALGWLKTNTATRAGKLRTVLRAIGSSASDDREALVRMGFESTSGLRGRLEMKLLSLGLRETRA